MGFSKFLCLLLLEEKKKAKMIIRISGFGFSVQTWRFRDAYLFSKNWLLKCLFCSALGVRFLGQVVKQGNFGHPPKINFD